MNWYMIYMYIVHSYYIYIYITIGLTAWNPAWGHLWLVPLQVDSDGRPHGGGFWYDSSFHGDARIFDSSFSFLHITQHDHEYDVSMIYWIHIISKHLRCFCLVLCHIQNFFGRDPQHLPWKSARIWLNSCCTCTRSVRQTGEISATRLGKLLRRQLEDGIGFRELTQHILPITKW